MKKLASIVVLLMLFAVHSVIAVENLPGVIDECNPRSSQTTIQQVCDAAYQEKEKKSFGNKENIFINGRRLRDVLIEEKIFPSGRAFCKPWTCEDRSENENFGNECKLGESTCQGNEFCASRDSFSRTIQVQGVNHRTTLPHPDVQNFLGLCCPKNPPGINLVDRPGDCFNLGYLGFSRNCQCTNHKEGKQPCRIALSGGPNRRDRRTSVLVAATFSKQRGEEDFTRDFSFSFLEPGDKVKLVTRFNSKIRCNEGRFPKDRSLGPIFAHYPIGEPQQIYEGKTYDKDGEECTSPTTAINFGVLVEKDWVIDSSCRFQEAGEKSACTDSDAFLDILRKPDFRRIHETKGTTKNSQIEHEDFCLSFNAIPAVIPWAAFPLTPDIDGQAISPLTDASYVEKDGTRLFLDDIKNIIDETKTGSQSALDELREFAPDEPSEDKRLSALAEASCNKESQVEVRLIQCSCGAGACQPLIPHCKQKLTVEDILRSAGEGISQGNDAQATNLMHVWLLDQIKESPEKLQEAHERSVQDCETECINSKVGKLARQNIENCIEYFEVIDEEILPFAFDRNQQTEIANIKEALEEYIIPMVDECNGAIKSFEIWEKEGPSAFKIRNGRKYQEQIKPGAIIPNAKATAHHYKALGILLAEVFGSHLEYLRRVEKVDVGSFKSLPGGFLVAIRKEFNEVLTNKDMALYPAMPLLIQHWSLAAVLKGYPANNLNFLNSQAATLSSNMVRACASLSGPDRQKCNSFQNKVGNYIANAKSLFQKEAGNLDNSIALSRQVESLNINGDEIPDFLSVKFCKNENLDGPFLELSSTPSGYLEPQMEACIAKTNSLGSRTINRLDTAFLLSPSLLDITDEIAETKDAMLNCNLANPEKYEMQKQYWAGKILIMFANQYFATLFRQVASVLESTPENDPGRGQAQQLQIPIRQEIEALNLQARTHFRNAMDAAREQRDQLPSAQDVAGVEVLHPEVVDKLQLFYDAARIHAQLLIEGSRENPRILEEAREDPNDANSPLIIETILQEFESKVTDTDKGFIINDRNPNDLTIAFYNADTEKRNKGIGNYAAKLYYLRGQWYLARNAKKENPDLNSVKIAIASWYRSIKFREDPYVKVGLIKLEGELLKMLSRAVNHYGGIVADKMWERYEKGTMSLVLSTLSGQNPLKIFDRDSNIVLDQIKFGAQSSLQFLFGVDGPWTHEWDLDVDPPRDAELYQRQVTKSELTAAGLNLIALYQDLFQKTLKDIKDECSDCTNKHANIVTDMSSKGFDLRNSFLKFDPVFENTDYIKIATLSKSGTIGSAFPTLDAELPPDQIPPGSYLNVDWLKPGFWKKFYEGMNAKNTFIFLFPAARAPEALIAIANGGTKLLRADATMGEWFFFGIAKVNIGRAGLAITYPGRAARDLLFNVAKTSRDRGNILLELGLALPENFIWHSILTDLTRRQIDNLAADASPGVVSAIKGGAEIMLYIFTAADRVTIRPPKANADAEDLVAVVTASKAEVDDIADHAWWSAFITRNEEELRRFDAFREAQLESAIAIRAPDVEVTPNTALFPDAVDQQDILTLVGSVDEVTDTVVSPYRTLEFKNKDGEITTISSMSEAFDNTLRFKDPTLDTEFRELMDATTGISRKRGTALIDSDSSPTLVFQSVPVPSKLAMQFRKNQALEEIAVNGEQLIQDALSKLNGNKRQLTRIENTINSIAQVKNVPEAQVVDVLQALDDLQFKYLNIKKSGVKQMQDAFEQLDPSKKIEVDEILEKVQQLRAQVTFNQVTNELAGKFDIPVDKLPKVNVRAAAGVDDIQPLYDNAADVVNLNLADLLDGPAHIEAATSYLLRRNFLDKGINPKNLKGFEEAEQYFQMLAKRYARDNLQTDSFFEYTVSESLIAWDFSADDFISEKLLYEGLVEANSNVAQNMRRLQEEGIPEGVTAVRTVREARIRESTALGNQKVYANKLDNLVNSPEAVTQKAYSLAKKNIEPAMRNILEGIPLGFRNKKDFARFSSQVLFEIDNLPIQFNPANVRVTGGAVKGFTDAGPFEKSVRDVYDVDVVISGSEFDKISEQIESSLRIKIANSNEKFKQGLLDELNALNNKRIRSGQLSSGDLNRLLGEGELPITNTLEIIGNQFGVSNVNVRVIKEGGPSDGAMAIAFANN